MNANDIDQLKTAITAVREGRIDRPLHVPQDGTSAEATSLFSALEELRQSLLERREDQSRTDQVLTLLEASSSLEGILDEMFNSLDALVPFDRIALALLSSDGTYLINRCVRTRTGVVRLHAAYQSRMDSTSLGKVLRRGRPRIINDLVEYLHARPLSLATRLIVEEGMRSSLTCPLIAMGRPVGFLFINSLRPRAYTTRHAQLLVHIANHVACLIDKARVYDKLERLDRWKTRLLGTIGHDLRSPLTVMKGYCGILQSNATTESQKHTALSRIDRACDHMTNLLRRLLDLSAIESGQLVIDMETVDLHAYLENFVADHAVIAEGKEIDVLLDCADAPRTAVLDPSRMNQVLTNLFGNAVKFSNPGSTIRVGAKPVTGGYLPIFVADHGPGIDPTKQAGIFQEFVCGDAQPTAGESSTGLGLAICKHIMDAHGGSIRVESAMGSGSTFTCLIPDRASTYRQPDNTEESQTRETPSDPLAPLPN